MHVGEAKGEECRNTPTIIVSLEGVKVRFRSPRGLNRRGGRGAKHLVRGLFALINESVPDGRHALGIVGPNGRVVPLFQAEVQRERRYDVEGDTHQQQEEEEPHPAGACRDQYPEGVIAKEGF